MSAAGEGARPGGETRCAAPLREDHSNRNVYAIDHVQLAMPTAAEAVARQFYCGLLGLEELPKPPNLEARGGLWFACGALQVHLGVDTDFRAAKKAHPALRVRNLGQLRAALETAGHTIKLDPEAIAGVERFFTEDPFGNRIEFVAPKGSS
ncbi:MAG: VOC family protein [Casimicrobiaceae bacterium]